MPLRPTSRVATSVRKIASAARGAASPAPFAPHAQSGGGNRIPLRYIAAGALTAGAIAYGMSGSLSDNEPRKGIAGVSTPALLRSYLVYTACGFPSVIDAAPGLLHAFTHSPIPGLKTVTEAVVRRTFFAQFVAGEDVNECLTQMQDMNQRGIGGVLNYSAEADLGDAGDSLAEAHHEAQQEVFAQCIQAIKGLGDLERHLEATGGATGSSSFALKVTGLIDPEVLSRASTSLCRLRPLDSSDVSPATFDAVPYPGLPQLSDAMIVSPVEGDKPLPFHPGAIEPNGIIPSDPNVTDHDLAELSDFWNKLRTMSILARDNNVRLMVDAEHAGTQPVMDAMTLLLSMEFNRPVPGVPFKGPIIFGTYQSYLRRAPFLVEHAIKHAEEHGYVLGVKLVRGAYVAGERTKWRGEGRGQDPIWPNKPATDKAYDDSVKTLTSTLAKQLKSPNPEHALSVVFATHNADSVKLVVDALQAEGLAIRNPAPPAGESTVDVAPLKLRDDVRGKVFIAQLYGMRDDITDSVATMFESNHVPVALKYIAYGRLDEVLPFLARRAIENKAVMAGEGGAAVEKKRVVDELKRRIFWFL